MDKASRLALIVDGISWATKESDLLAVVPELRDEVPPVEELDGHSCILLASPMPLFTGILETLCVALEAPQQMDTLVDAPDAKVRQDPVVSALLGLWMESGRPGAQGQVVPALAAVWATSRLVSCTAPWVNRMPEPLVKRWLELRGVLQTDDRTACLQAISGRLSARMNAALTMARGAGVNIRAGGLARRLMTNPLVMAYPSGALDPRTDMGAVAALLGCPLDESMLVQLTEIAELAWAGVLDRVANRKPTGVDGILHQLVGQRSGALVLMDPIAGPALLRALPQLVDTKQLTGAGLDGRVAKAMLSDRALRPLSATWTDLVRPVRAWEVISTLAGMVTPIWQDKGGVQVRGKLHHPAARWSLRLPRLDSTEHAVVAVRLAPLIDKAMAHHPRARDTVHACWAALMGAYPGAVSTLAGDMGLAAFSDPERAVHFAEMVHCEIPGSDGILTQGDGGVQVAVPPDLRVGVGLAWGRVDGGTDGVTTWLEGPAVGTAMALMGQAGPTLRVNDPLSIRSAVGQADGLKSDGIVADRSLLDALLRTLRHPAHTHGSKEEVAGIAEDFRCYPVPYWWDDGSRVWIWLELGLRLSEGPAELTVVSRSMFKDIHNRDRELEHSDIAPPPGISFTSEAPSRSAPEPAAPAAPADPAKDWSPFDALGRGSLRSAGTTDPWAQIDDGPQLEIDDD